MSEFETTNLSIKHEMTLKTAPQQRVNYGYFGKRQSVRVLDPEDENGNIEYKRQILNPTYARSIGLTTQLSFRLDQGMGLALYMLGVEDNGYHSLSSLSDLKKSVSSLARIAKSLGAEVTKVTIIPFSQEEIDIGSINLDVDVEDLARAVVQIHHHDVSGRFGIDHMKPNDKESIVGVPNNFLVFGPSGAGKSSLIGSLLSNDLDDGKGYARCCVLRHRHEFSGGNVGQSSCVGRFWVEEDNGKQVILTDTPGNQKYLKQTLAAATLAVDYALLVVDFNLMGQSEYVAEICKFLSFIQNNFMNKRVLVVVNKSEKSKNKPKKSTLPQLLSGYKSVEVSCVTGRNLQYLKKILFSLPKQRSNHLDKADEPFEFLVTATHTNLTDAKIIEGYVRSGSINLARSPKVLFSDVDVDVKIKSIQINRKNKTKVTAGQFCSLGLELLSGDESCSKIVENSMKVITENGHKATERFSCRVQFLSELRKTYNNATIQLIYLNNRVSAKLSTIDADEEKKCEQEEDSLDMVDCEIVVDGGIWLASGVRFYVCDFSCILGVGRIP